MLASLDLGGIMDGPLFTMGTYSPLSSISDSTHLQAHEKLTWGSEILSSFG